MTVSTDEESQKLDVDFAKWIHDQNETHGFVADTDATKGTKKKGKGTQKPAEPNKAEDIEIDMEDQLNKAEKASQEAAKTKEVCSSLVSLFLHVHNHVVCFALSCYFHDLGNA